jgi:hypothetical protein
LQYATYEEATLFELRFWLQVLGDHGRFIFGALAADEREEISRAELFIGSFDSLLEAARAGGSAQRLLELNRAAYLRAQEIRMFKLHLLERHLIGKIKLNLPPSFLNHMVNEVEEAIAALHYLQAGHIPPLQDALHHHLLWLQDAYGHSASISARLDMVEKRLKEASD